MFITALTIKQFRCFQSTSLEFTKPLVLIEGPNGSGKTSLLEALNYSCYLRSFRTRATRELMHFGASAFSIKIQFTPPDSSANNNLLVGYSPEKRSVKINDAPIESYKDLISSYRIITITDDDLFLIKGVPEVRRSFLDQAITLTDPGYPSLLRHYSAILEQRNALLYHQDKNKESYDLWTDQLVAASLSIRQKRQALVLSLEKKINNTLVTFFEGALSVKLTYKSKEMPRDITAQEYAVRHSLFGAHLDDCSIFIADKASKYYASRGQQKLITMLLKLSQPATQHPESCVFLLDDVVSDLDNNRLTRLFTLLSSYKTQVIITSPVAHPLLHTICQPYDYERIQLTTPP